MRQRDGHEGRRSFTLIEMMMVVVMIAIILALFFTAAITMRKRAKLNQIATDLRRLEVAVKAYYLEFGEWPGQTGSADQTFVTNNGIVIDLLRGYNSRNRVFLTLDDHQLYGVSAQASYSWVPYAWAPGTFVDPYGNPYVIAMDCNNDNVLKVNSGVIDPVQFNCSIAVTVKTCRAGAATWYMNPPSAVPADARNDWAVNPFVVSNVKYTWPDRYTTNYP